MNENLFASTPLLVPLKIKLPLKIKEKGEAFLSSLEPFGFEGLLNEAQEVEFFAEPKVSRKIEWKEVFEEIFDRLDESKSVDSLFVKLKNWVASSLSCHGSVRRGQRLSNEEIKALLRSLDEVDWKEFCPHGRPTWVRLSHQKLEQEFHRS